jgi:hypothetical protein
VTAGDGEPGGELELRQRDALERGARLAAGLIGAGVGLIGGPIGAGAGAVAGWAAGEAFIEVLQRVGSRGGTRAAAALVVMDVDARERAERGERVRDDGFFEAPGYERQSPADELLEAVLRQAAEAVEEEKLPYLSRIYTAVERDETVAPADAQYLVGLAGRLTFRQLVALSVLSHYDQHAGALDEATGSPPDVTSADPDVRIELADLINQQLVGVGDEFGDEFRVEAVGDPLRGVYPRSDLSFMQLRLLPHGEQLVRLMGLDRIEEPRRLEWLRQLGAGE